MAKVSRVHNHHPAYLLVGPAMCFLFLPVSSFYGRVMVNLAHMRAFFAAPEDSATEELAFQISKQLVSRNPIWAVTFGLFFGLVLVFVRRIPMRRHPELIVESAFCSRSELKQNDSLRQFLRQTTTINIGILAAAVIVCLLFTLGYFNFILAAPVVMVILYPEQRRMYERMLARFDLSTEDGRVALAAVRKRVRRNIGLMLIFIVGTACFGSVFTYARWTGFREVHIIDRAIHGIDMSTMEAARMEERLEIEPEDLERRASLLGYYSTRTDSPEGQIARLKHSDWVLQNAPGSLLVRTRFVRQVGSNKAGPPEN